MVDYLVSGVETLWDREKMFLPFSQEITLGLTDAQRLGSDADSATVERVHGDFETHARFADEIFFGDVHVFEN